MCVCVSVYICIHTHIQISISVCVYVTSWTWYLSFVASKGGIFSICCIKSQRDAGRIWHVLHFILLLLQTGFPRSYFRRNETQTTQRTQRTIRKTNNTNIRHSSTLCHACVSGWVSGSSEGGNQSPFCATYLNNEGAEWNIQWKTVLNFRWQQRVAAIEQKLASCWYFTSDLSNQQILSFTVWNVWPTIL